MLLFDSIERLDLLFRSFPDEKAERIHHISTILSHATSHIANSDAKHHSNHLNSRLNKILREEKAHKAC